MDNTGLEEKILEWRRKLDLAPREGLIRFSKSELLDRNIPDSSSPLKPNHYASTIDPYAYALANDLGGLEMNVVKYVTRWKKKNGVEDLKKALETLKRLIDWADNERCSR